MKGLRSHREISFLCLLLLFGASRGMPQPREHGTDWEHCKNASQEVIQELWKLKVKPLSLRTNVPFPEKIACEDYCDPESLAKDNKMDCLKKINQVLHHYQNLLGLYSEAQDISDLQSALKKLSGGILLQKGPDVTEGIHPSINPITSWESRLLLQHTLWRLQSFSVVVARVFTHGAALNVKIQQ